ncbi:hypothetical protein ACFL0F_00560 [Patescibacteria group bacterium]
MNKNNKSKSIGKIVVIVLVIVLMVMSFLWLFLSYFKLNHNSRMVIDEKIDYSRVLVKWIPITWWPYPRYITQQVGNERSVDVGYAVIKDISRADGSDTVNLTLKLVSGIEIDAYLDTNTLFGMHNNEYMNTEKAQFKSEIPEVGEGTGPKGIPLLVYLEMDYKDIFVNDVVRILWNSNDDIIDRLYLGSIVRRGRNERIIGDTVR